mmetsp:Transcript_26805/g.64825  ORF Transcript_26805/g.64825 Transcript_26805/m.64825 type:complete len:115 (-) Transcript_26805:141-485(-)
MRCARPGHSSRGQGHADHRGGGVGGDLSASDGAGAAAAHHLRWGRGCLGGTVLGTGSVVVLGQRCVSWERLRGVGFSPSGRGLSLATSAVAVALALLRPSSSRGASAAVPGKTT